MEFEEFEDNKNLSLTRFEKMLKTNRILFFDSNEFENIISYYLENGKIVYTEEYLKRRGTCCGGGCRHCVFDPIHTKGNKNLREDLGKNLTDSE